jgi:2-hydroxymuconate-semialdehyde hydrolase
LNSAIRDGRSLVVDGLETNYVEMGSGPTLLLLHSGEYGATADLSWEYALPVLAETHRVVAPEWLGYGRSAKVHDFERGTGLLLDHMGRFCEELGIADVPVIASSLGASLALADASSEHPRIPASAIVAICGGGDIARNSHVDALFSYDGSLAAMRRIVEALFEGEEWLDDAYVARRHLESLVPGAWECVSAPRFRAPHAGEPPARPKPDYERISVPTLLIAGDKDKIKPAGWAHSLQSRISSCQVFVAEGCGHLPHIEQPDLIHAVLLEFLEKL